MASQGKSSTPRSHGSGGGMRPFQNYPMEPIGTRPSYIGEAISLVRDGTEEMKQLLETECDLRFNCKVCGSILPTARSFLIHKRQFCTMRYLDYQRRNVTIMERVSNLVSFETRSFQTDPMEALELLNPINASLFTPLPSNATLVNGHHNAGAHRLETAEKFKKTVKEQPASSSSTADEEAAEDESEMDAPAGVEVIQPVRPPADGIYRFGMGGENLLASRKKKHRTNSMAPPRKRKTKPLLFDFSGEGLATSSVILSKESGSRTPVKNRDADFSVQSVSPPMNMQDAMGGMNAAPLQPIVHKVATEKVHLLPANHGGMEPTKRSRRIAGVQPLSEEPQPPNGPPLPDPFHNDRSEIKLTPEQNERLNAIKDPIYIRTLLQQLAEVADYDKKICRECNRTVVSIYNLDRHVATQHLGLRESEYSLISKELRRMRTEIYGPVKNDDTREPSVATSTTSATDRTARSKTEENRSSVDPTEPADLSASGSQSETRNDDRERDEPVPDVGSSDMSADPESLGDHIYASPLRNPNTLKEIAPSEREMSPQTDYQPDQLIDIQRQILDAADPVRKCCRLCDKQYFDVYVLNRHVMTVHLKLPEKSCGTINKLIKEHMRRHPDAFQPEPREAIPSLPAEISPLPLVIAGDSDGSQQI